MKWLFRFAALVALALWTAALFAPFQIRCLIHCLNLPLHDEHAGYWILALGWFLGPLSLSLAWYVNVPLFICVTRLGLGRHPGTRTTIVGLILALTALLPVTGVDIETSGWATLRGPAIWLWLLSFCVVTIATIGASPASRAPID
jgi:hypothetical protein